jgi:hypothetical protein
MFMKWDQQVIVLIQIVLVVLIRVQRNVNMVNLGLIFFAKLLKGLFVWNVRQIILVSQQIQRGLVEAVRLVVVKGRRQTKTPLVTLVVSPTLGIVLGVV